MGDLIEQKKIISAEQTEQVIIKALVDCMIKHKGLHETSDAVLDALHNIPAVDAVPVVNGKWESKNRNMYGAISGLCSICGMYAGLWLRNMPYKYCPYCGAKMDGEENVK